MVNTINTKQPGYEIETWETSIPELKQTIEMKTSVMGVFGVIMLVIAAIGILNLLMMAVFERTREIGVMGALGLKPQSDHNPVPAGRHPDRGGRRCVRRNSGHNHQWFDRLLRY